MKKKEGKRVLYNFTLNAIRQIQSIVASINTSYTIKLLIVQINAISLSLFHVLFFFFPSKFNFPPKTKSFINGQRCNAITVLRITGVRMLVHVVCTGVHDAFKPHPDERGRQFYQSYFTPDRILTSRRV